MSKFVYKVYMNDEFVHDFTSINHILNHYHFKIPEQSRQKLIYAFKIPAFEKRELQTYIDSDIGLKVVTECIVFIASIPSNY